MYSLASADGNGVIDVNPRAAAPSDWPGRRPGYSATMAAAIPARRQSCIPPAGARAWPVVALGRWLAGAALAGVLAGAAAVAGDGAPPPPVPGPGPGPGPGSDLATTAAAAAATWQALFALAVPMRLAVPPAAQAAYAAQARQALQDAAAGLAAPQFVLVVDRAAEVQAALLYLAAPGAAADWAWIGAVPVATGRPGGFEHFLTPLGAFRHDPANPDFRAEGTRNEFGVRGYGVQGLRVFDFGWVAGERTWGGGGPGTLRLQVHATDPDLLEPRLGQRGSKGCVRIPAALNRFLDHNGVLDADYDAAQARGQRFWLFAQPPLPNPWAGRWLVVLDSASARRPDWAVPRR